MPQAACVGPDKREEVEGRLEDGGRRWEKVGGGGKKVGRRWEEGGIWEYKGGGWA